MTVYQVLNSNKHISLSLSLYLHDIESKAYYLLYIFVCDMLLLSFLNIYTLLMAYVLSICIICVKCDISVRTVHVSCPNLFCCKGT